MTENGSARFTTGMKNEPTASAGVYPKGSSRKAEVLIGTVKPEEESDGGQNQNAELDSRSP